MAARTRKRRWRRLERWQVLLAAVVAAVASIIVALVSLPHSGSTGTSSISSGTTSVSLAITGLSEQSSPPPPGRLYMWSGTIRDLPPDALIFVIAKSPGFHPQSLVPGESPVPVPTGESSQPWLVSPQATILNNGTWTVTWFIAEPPSTVRWIAVVWIPPSPPSCSASGCQAGTTPHSLSDQGPSTPGVQVTATYPPRSTR